MLSSVNSPILASYAMQTEISKENFVGGNIVGSPFILLLYNHLNTTKESLQKILQFSHFVRHFDLSSSFIIFQKSLSSPRHFFPG